MMRTFLRNLPREIRKRAYPFAIRVIHSKVELIVAVDQYNGPWWWRRKQQEDCQRRLLSHRSMGRVQYSGLFLRLLMRIAIAC
jgi:hypothetical protein